MFENSFFARSEDIEHASLVMEVSNCINTFEETYSALRSDVMTYGESALGTLGKFIISMIKGAFKGIVSIFKSIIGMVFGAGMKLIGRGGSMGGSIGGSTGSSIAKSYVDPRMVEDMAKSLSSESPEDIAKLRSMMEVQAKSVTSQHNRLAIDNNKKISLTSLMKSISKKDANMIQNMLNKNTIHNVVVNGVGVREGLEKLFTSTSHKDLFGENGKSISIAYPKATSGTRVDNATKATELLELVKECETMNNTITKMIADESDGESILGRFDDKSNSAIHGSYGLLNGSYVVSDRLTNSGFYSYLNRETNNRFTAINKAFDKAGHQNVKDLKIVEATSGAIDDVKTHAGLFELEVMDFVSYLKKHKGTLHAYALNEGSLYKATNLDDPWSNFTYGFCKSLLNDDDVDPETGLPNNSKQRRYGNFEKEIRKSMKSFEEAGKAIERAEGAFLKRIEESGVNDRNTPYTGEKHMKMTRLQSTDNIINSLSLTLKRGISVVNMAYSASRFAVYNTKVSAFINRAYEIYNAKVTIELVLDALTLVDERVNANNAK